MDFKFAIPRKFGKKLSKVKIFSHNLSCPVKKIYYSILFRFLRRFCLPLHIIIKKAHYYDRENKRFAPGNCSIYSNKR